ncbi:uncharacterized protein [Amphiura filiformis]|uniref:uncharacterized protein n=1 Tax=Amphiura filiformis TaxID=82378 RepID=UPI003B2168D4
MYTGRCLQCRDQTDMIAASVFPCLQVRIMRGFNRERHRPIISRMAIKFAHKVEGMVQLSQDRRAIMLAVRSKGHDEKTLRNMKAQLDELMLIIRTMLEQRSVGTQVVLRYLSPVSLRRSTNLEMDVHSYSEEEVQMSEDEDTPLIDPRTNNTESVQDVIGPGYTKKVPNSILRWRHALRSSQDLFCSTVVPSDLLPHLTDIISQEDEQAIKTKETNEGVIRASRMLVDHLLRSTETTWPDVLLNALDNIDHHQNLKLVLSERFMGTS